LPDNKIRDKILRDARDDAKKIVDEAKKRIEEILKEAEENVREITEDTKRMAEDAASRELERKLSEARMEKRKAILEKKRGIIDAVFENAKERILSLKRQEYIGFISDIIADETKKGDFELVLAEDDVKRFGKTVFEEIVGKSVCKAKVIFETGTFTGGCILKKEKYEYNATVDTILERVKEKLETKLAKILFK